MIIWCCFKNLNHKRWLTEAEKVWANIVETDIGARNIVKHLDMQAKKWLYTPWTVTKAVYAMDKRGNCTEIVFLANNLNEDDSAEIRKHLANLHFQNLQNDIKV